MPSLEELQNMQLRNYSPLLLCFGWSVFQSIEHIVLQKLLIRDTYFYGLPCRAMLTVPKKRGEKKKRILRI